MPVERQRQSQPWLGGTVDGMYRLDQFLGEGKDGAAFRTDFSRRRATIKLIADDGALGDAQLAAWQSAAKLNHPHLARVLASGRSEIKGTPVLFVVTEFADETMAHVLAERLLSPTEARDVMATALDVLGYLHGQGFSHGHLKASNFLAVGEKLKLSGDGVTAGSTDSDDVRMLGELFADALPKPLAQPFLDITQHAADPNPRTRWSIAEIATRLEGRMPVRGMEAKRAVWWYVLPAVAVVVAAIIFLMVRGPRHTELDGRAPVEQPAPIVTQTVPEAKSEPAAEAKSEPAPEPPPPAPVPEARPKAPAKKERPGKTAAAVPTTEGIVSQPLPDVPGQAMRTIHGKLTVPVRVDVDGAGNVRDAKLESSSVSRYFAGLAMKSARQWKFAPSGAPQAWLLRFEFTRQTTKVSSARIGR